MRCIIGEQLRFHSLNETSLIFLFPYLDIFGERIDLNFAGELNNLFGEYLILGE